jgi:hypothetical protein
LGIGKRPRGLGGIWDDDYYDEPNELDRAKRRRSEGDVLRNNENIQVGSCHWFIELGNLCIAKLPSRQPLLPLEISSEPAQAWSSAVLPSVIHHYH